MGKNKNKAAAQATADSIPAVAADPGTSADDYSGTGVVVTRPAPVKVIERTLTTAERIALAERDPRNAADADLALVLRHISDRNPLHSGHHDVLHEVALRMNNPSLRK